MPTVAVALLSDTPVTNWVEEPLDGIDWNKLVAPINDARFLRADSAGVATKCWQGPLPSDLDTLTSITQTLRIVRSDRGTATAIKVRIQYWTRNNPAEGYVFYNEQHDLGAGNSTPVEYPISATGLSIPLADFEPDRTMMVRIVSNGAGWTPLNAFIEISGLYNGVATYLPVDDSVPAEKTVGLVAARTSGVVSVAKTYGTVAGRTSGTVSVAKTIGTVNPPN